MSDQTSFIFRFDRRLTVGEVPEQAVADVDALDAVRAAREAGLHTVLRRAGAPLTEAELRRLDDLLTSEFLMHRAQLAANLDRTLEERVKQRVGSLV